MTLPNKLTLSRLILTPIFCLFFCLLHKSSPNLIKFRVVISVIVLILYVIMEITDVLDGALARKNNSVTDLGKVFDPFSDCFMHLSFFVLFVRFKYISLIAFFVILWRELLINFLRMLLSGVSVVLPANIFGKLKTIFYAFMSFCIIIFVVENGFVAFNQNSISFVIKIFHILSYFAAFFSFSSFLIYAIQVKKSGALDNLTK